MITVTSFWQRAVLISALGAISQSAFGLNEIPDFYQEPGVNSSRSVQVGNDGTEFIDPLSGVLRLSYRDLVVPGNGGLDIVIERTYHSLQRNPNIIYSPVLRGRMTTGVGWDIYFGRLYYEGSLTPSACIIPRMAGAPLSTKNPVFELPDGSRKVFFNALPGSPYPLVSKDRWVAECVEGRHTEGERTYIDGGLLIRSPDGTQFRVDRYSRARGTVQLLGGLEAETFAWHVTEIKDAIGNTLSFDYVDRGPAQYTELKTITASDGRVVTFTYTNPGNTSLLTRIESAGEIWEYDYTDVPGVANSYGFLTKVRGPEGLEWSYDYHLDGPGLYSMRTVIAPFGGRTDYTYQLVQLGAFPALSVRTVALETKTTSGPDVAPGTWTYRFFRDEAISQLDLTEVITPATRELYQHCSAHAVIVTGGEVQGGRCRGLEGSLVRKDVYAPGALVPILSEQYLWGAVRVSDQWEQGEFRAYVTPGIYARRLLQRTVSRDGQHNTTVYSNFDAYDNPGVISEYSGFPLEYGSLPGDSSRLRQRTFTYHTDPVRWIVRLPKDESMTDISVVFEGTTRPMTATTARTYYDNGLLETQTVHGRTTRVTYHATGDVETVTDPLLRVTRYSDYYRGIPRREEHPESVLVTREVTARGNVRRETNGRGYSTTYAHDRLNRVIGIATPRTDDTDVLVDHAFRSGQHGAPSRILMREAFEGKQWVDGFGRVIRIESDGIARRFEFDALGRKALETDPFDVTSAEPPAYTSYLFDALGRVIETTHSADGSKTRIDLAAGVDQVRVTDERGQDTLYTYRSFGSPDARELVRIDSPEDVSTTIERYRTGAPFRVSQGRSDASQSLTRSYVLDTGYQLDAIVHPETGVERLEYDDAGNRIESTRNLVGTTLYTYDGLDRLTQVSYPDGSPPVELGYDGNGNLDYAARGDIHWDYEYDENDNLVSEEATIGSETYTLRYEYDLQDALRRIEYPSGLAVDYAPNARGWPTQARPYVTRVDYYPNGLPKTIEAANGVVSRYGQTPRLRVGSIVSSKNNDVHVDLGYDYDPIGNVEKILDGVSPANDVALGYDGLSRLRSAVGPWGTASYDYSVHGDLTRKSIGGTELLYEYGTTTRTGTLSAITGDMQVPFSYDAFGNMRSNGRNSLVYDAAGKLAEVQYLVSGTRIKSFEYDGNGQRTRELGFDSKTTLHDRTGRLMFEREAVSCRQRDYVRLGSILVAKRETTYGDDADTDGISDCVEANVGLDPRNAADAALDLDGDGVSNLDEFSRGTRINHEDSDNDGLDDGYEIAQGFDPLVDDASQDTDGDGATNLHEFLSRSDPNDPNSIPGQTPGTLRWVYGVDGEITGPGALGPDGTLYVQSSLRTDAIDSNGSLRWSKGGGVTQVAVSSAANLLMLAGRTLYSYDTTGALQWSLAVEDVSTASGMGVGPDDTIFVSTRGYIDIPARDNTQRSVLQTSVVAIDGRAGRVKWQRPTQDVPSAGFRVRADGSVIMQLDAHSIELRHPSGNRRWQNSQNFYLANAAPALAPDGNLYAPIKNGLVALDQHGHERWRVAFGKLPHALVLGAGNEVHVFAEDTWAVIDAGDGARLRTTMPGFEAVVSAAVADNGEIYVLAKYRDKPVTEVVAYAATGEELWRFDLNDQDGERLLLGPDGTLHVFADRDAGQNGRVFAIKTASTGPVASGWPMSDMGGVRRTGNAGGCAADDTDLDGIPDCVERLSGFDPLDAADGADDADRDGLSNAQEHAAGTDPLYADSDGDEIDDGYEATHGLDPLNGEDAGSDADGDGASNAREYLTGFAADDGASVPPASAAPPGSLKWSHSLAPGARIESVAMDTDDTLYFVQGGTLHALTRSGDTKWTSPFPYQDAADISIGLHGMGYAVTHTWGGDLVEFDLATGGLRVIDVGAGVTTPTVVKTDGTVYAGAGRRLIAYRGGAVRIVHEEPYDIVDLLMLDTSGALYAVNDRNDLFAVDEYTGREIWRFDLKSRTNSTAAYTSNGSLLVSVQGFQIWRIRGDGEVIYGNSAYTNTGGAYAIGPYDVFYQQGLGMYETAPYSGRIRSSLYSGAGDVRSGAVVDARGHLYFVATEGLYATDPLAADVPLWTYPGSVSNHLNGVWPLLGRDGTVYARDTNGGIVAVHGSGMGALAKTTWPMLSHDRARTRYVGTMLNRATVPPPSGTPLPPPPNDPDRDPTVEIVSPSATAVPYDGRELTLSAVANDTEDGDLGASIQWAIYGESRRTPVHTGNGATLSLLLQPGQYTLIASVRDSADQAATDEHVMSVTPPPPSLYIDAPEQNSRLPHGSAVTLTGRAQELLGADLSDSIVWTSDLDGTLGSGASVQVSLSLGQHLITASVDTPDGRRSQTHRSVEMYEPVDYSRLHYDGERDGDAGWSIADSTPAGAAIATEIDGESGQQVVVLTGSGTKNAFRFRSLGGGALLTYPNHYVSWRMRASAWFKIKVRVETNAGARNIVYLSSNGLPSVNGTTVTHRLGSNTRDGKWWDIERDLSADLVALDPGLALVSVSYWELRGSGRVSHISSSDQLEFAWQRPLEDGSTAAAGRWSIADSSPAGAAIASEYDALRGSDVIVLTGTGTKNAFRLRDDAGQRWQERRLNTLELALRHRSSFVLTVRVTSSTGTRYLKFRPGTKADYTKGSSRYVYLGAGLNDDRWHDHSLNLMTELQAAWPGHIIHSIDELTIRGSVRVDDVRLVFGRTTPIRLR